MIAYPRLSWEMLTLKLRNPFRISYGVSETRTAFWVRLENDEGWGEGTIPPYYHVDLNLMTAYWLRMSEKKEPFPDHPDEVPLWVEPDGPAPARSAIDLALYDRIGKKRGQPLYRVLALPKPQPMPTSFTIAIDTPQLMAEMAARMAPFSILKIKLGGEGDDEARLAAVRAARPDATLRIDANAGWSREEAFRMVGNLEKYDLEMIEQPLARDDFEGLGMVQARTGIQIVADESVQSMADVEKLAAAGVKAINLKLMKVGGLTSGLAILRRARELGMQVMLGCMIETSLGTAAVGHLMGLADWIDLDAPMLISNDPFSGLDFSLQGVLTVSDRPGIGVDFRI